jgi:hypothetical protein
MREEQAIVLASSQQQVILGMNGGFQVSDEYGSKLRTVLR